MAEVRPCGSARVRDGSGEGGSQDARCTERGGGCGASKELTLRRMAGTNL